MQMIIGEEKYKKKVNGPYNMKYFPNMDDII